MDGKTFSGAFVFLAIVAAAFFTCAALGCIAAVVLLVLGFNTAAIITLCLGCGAGLFLALWIARVA